MRRTLIPMILAPALALGLIFGQWLSGGPPSTETDYVSALIWGGAIYYLSIEEADEISKDAVVGYVISETDTFPQKDGQANFCAPGTPIARTEEGLAVLLDGVWRLCRSKEAGPAGTAD